MIAEITAFTVLVVGLIALLIYFRRLESRTLRGKTRDTLSTGLRQEIEEERAASAERQRQFDEALKKAQEGPRE